MKIRLRHGLSVVAITVFCILTSVFTAFAATMTGDLDTVSSTEISGWAVDKDSPDTTVEIGIYVYADASTQAMELTRITADQYRSDSAKLYGTGNHSFSYAVNWNDLNGTSFTVQAYALTDGHPAHLLDSVSYNKNSGDQSSNVVKTETGPAGAKTISQSAQTSPTVTETGKPGTYLGKFTTTAYCCCTTCSGGIGKTYSGTVPKANHTISADINHYPIGTKLMIGNTVYTVEDIGTGVNGNKLDIYFDTHQQALNYGRKTVDVYAAQ